MTRPAAPLEKAVEALRDDLKYVNADHVEHDAGSDAADVIRSAEALLAALDADRGEAEAALREIAALGATAEYVGDDDEKSLVCDACACHIDKYPHDDNCAAERARRYFARREREKGGNRGI